MAISSPNALPDPEYPYVWCMVTIIWRLLWPLVPCLLWPFHKKRRLNSKAHTSRSGRLFLNMVRKTREKLNVKKRQGFWIGPYLLKYGISSASPFGQEKMPSKGGFGDFYFLYLAVGGQVLSTRLQRKWDFLSGPPLNTCAWLSYHTYNVNVR